MSKSSAVVDYVLYTEHRSWSRWSDAKISFDYVHPEHAKVAIKLVFLLYVRCLSSPSSG